jgi:hypothetical protein
MIVTAECDYTIKNQFLIIINIGGRSYGYLFATVKKEKGKALLSLKRTLINLILTSLSA